MGGGRERERETVSAWETPRVMSANIVQSEFISIVIAYYCNIKKIPRINFFDAFAIHFAVYVEKIALMVSLHWLKLYIISCAHFILRDWIHNCLFNFQYMNQLIFVVKTQHHINICILSIFECMMSMDGFWIWVYPYQLINNTGFDTWINQGRNHFRTMENCIKFYF